MGGLNRSFVEHGQGVVEILRIIVVVWDGEIIAKGIDDYDDGFIERFRMPASFKVRPKIMKMKRGGGTIRFVFENQSSQKKSFGEEVYPNALKTARTNRSVIDMAWSDWINTQYPQKEAAEESMARFESQFLLCIGLFDPNFLRFPGLCTCILPCTLLLFRH